MILLDNSEYMRNGDYIPTRLEAQQDAANLLVGAKTQSHPESTVGVSAGTQLLVSPTDDVGKILNALHGLEFNGVSNVTASVQVASLALKHRRNKNGAQKIVLFVGSPLNNVETKALQKAGRQLKKNNVSIDVVAMGELEENEPKLKELVDAANGRSDEGERTCNLVTIPAGVLPSDVLASSPIVHGGTGGSAFAASAAAGAAAAGNVGAGGGDFADFGGIDPNMDPELAMALRVSMEEERARQERAAAALAASSNEESKDAEMTDASPPDPPAGGDAEMTEEEALLQQALAMSMNENEPATEETTAAAKPAEAPEEMDEDAAMQMALQMSMQTEEEAPKEEAKSDQQFQDPQFVNQVRSSCIGYRSFPCFCLFVLMRSLVFLNPDYCSCLALSRGWIPMIPRFRMLFVMLKVTRTMTQKRRLKTRRMTNNNKVRKLLISCMNVAKVEY
jgi:26S proteasome regulatory subunit N10